LRRGVFCIGGNVFMKRGEAPTKEGGKTYIEVLDLQREDTGRFEKP